VRAHACLLDQRVDPDQLAPRIDQLRRSVRKVALRDVEAALDVLHARSTLLAYRIGHALGNLRALSVQSAARSRNRWA
jgi:hypothetical protein